MRKVFTFIFISLLFTQLKAQDLGGIPHNVIFMQKKSKQAIILFPKELDSIANQILNIFTQLDNTTKNSLGNKTKKWNVVLQNLTVIPNAYVRMAPKRSEFYMTPDFDNITSGTLPWSTLLAAHEYRHIQQFSNFNNGIAKIFTLLLGEQGQLLANGITIPDYFFEGDAVYQETLTTKQGRGQLPAFLSTTQALWYNDKNPSWMQIRNGSYKKQYPNHYEIGYQLVAYGYEKFGTDFWRKVTYDASSFKGLFYPFAKAIKNYSGINYKQFRNDALTYFKQPMEKQVCDFVMPVSKTITNYYYPQIKNNKIITLKSSYNTNPKFVLIENGKEKTIAKKSFALDDYFSTNHKQIVYSIYATDKRYNLKNYSNISVIEIATGKEKRITNKEQLFHPSINNNGKLIIAVQTKPIGSNTLVLLNANSGVSIKTFTNENNYIFTFPKFIDDNNIVSIIRNSEGENAIAKVTINNNSIEIITPFTYKAMGYPSINNDTMYFTFSHQNTNCVAALDLKSNQCYTITNNINSIFYPTMQNRELYFAKVTSNGQLLMHQNIKPEFWQLLTKKDFITNTTNYLPVMETRKNTVKLVNAENNKTATTNYKKAWHLFKPHSYTLGTSVNEYSINILSDNILNSMSSSIDYTYNTAEHSSAINFNTIYGGLFPFINVGIGTTLNRNVLVGSTLTNFNTAKIYAGLRIPLQKYRDRFFQALTIGNTITSEQIYYSGIGKNILQNNNFLYNSFFATASNQIQMAKQHINPRWAQVVSISYRDALSFINNKKLVVNSSFYFPGFAKTHSLVLHFSYQNRDTLRDYFSKSFSFARGYESLNTRRMLKFGVDYHLPIIYPDFGIGNIAFLQRVRASLFYDYNNSKARVSGVLQNIKYNSTGAEIYFDGKIWNALPVNIGIRYTQLLNTDLIYPFAKNKWEIILPIDIVPR